MTSELSPKIQNGPIFPVPAQKIVPCGKQSRIWPAAYRIFGRELLSRKHGEITAGKQTNLPETYLLLAATFCWHFEYLRDMRDAIRIAAAPGAESNFMNEPTEKTHYARRKCEVRNAVTSQQATKLQLMNRIVLW